MEFDAGSYVRVHSTHWLRNFWIGKHGLEYLVGRECVLSSRVPESLPASNESSTKGLLGYDFNNDMICGRTTGAFFDCNIILGGRITGLLSVFLGGFVDIRMVAWIHRKIRI